MAKKWEPMPEDINQALIVKIEAMYAEELKTLPKLGFPNPAIRHESTKNGFSAKVEFFWDVNNTNSALFEYDYKNRSWYMSRDWND